MGFPIERTVRTIRRFNGDDKKVCNIQSNFVHISSLHLSVVPMNNVICGFRIPLTEWFFVGG